MSLSPNQIAKRLEGMTATDVAAIVGCHPHRGPINVYLEKVGQAPPFIGNKRTKWGEILEPAIRNDYEERHNVTVEVHGTHAHPRHEWWMATPDGLVYPRGSRMPVAGLEIKVHGHAEIWAGNIEYGQPGTDEVPPHELIQCEWGMGATELDRWDLVTFIDGVPEDYRIHRDDELIRMLEERAERFLVDNVRARVPPEPDGSKAWDDWLKRRWEKNTAELVSVDLDPATMQMIYGLRDLRVEAFDLEAKTDRLIQEIKTLIGDRAGFTWREPGRRKPSKLTWKRSKDSARTDNKGTVEALRTTAALFVSARGADVDRVIAAIPHEEAVVLNDAMTALRAIAAMPTKMIPMPGARPFNVPRHWPKTKAKEDEEANHDNAEEN